MDNKQGDGSMDNAGKLNKEWINDCANNESDGNTLTDWVQTAINSQEAEVDKEGSVWTGSRWLDQDECNELMAKIDAGV